MTPAKKEAPLAWRQDEARLGSLRGKIGDSAHGCKRVEPYINDSHSLILKVVELALTPTSEELALQLRLLGRKVKRDANRLVFDLQRKSAAKQTARVSDRAANIGSDT